MIIAQRAYEVNSKAIQTADEMLSLANKLYLISFATLAAVTFWDNHNALMITLAFLPFIIIGVIPSNLLGPLCVNFMPQAKAKVSAVLQGARLLFASLSLQIAGYFYQGSFRNIGIIILTFILLMIITQFFVLRNRELMAFAISDQT